MTVYDKLLLAILLVVFAHNMTIDIMEVDAMQYAGMSKEMSETGEYLHVHEFGRDYLDKPPLLFWLSSLSITIFGAHNFAYKLPSVLMLLLGLYGIYRFTRIYYTERIAIDALLILGSAQAFNQMTNDVRTDGLLTSSVALGLWLMAEYIESKKLKYLLLASVAVGLAMLAKGPIGFVAILFPIGCHLMLKNKWRQIFSPQWLWLIIVVGIMLTPMLWGLYTQYDLHPEKEVYGLKGPSGILFYFWTQSFGRITGDIYWDNGLPWHFFLGSIWWDFFPWVVFLFPALYQSIRRFRKLPEYISLVCFVSLFAIMSLSSYKLPHYVFVSFSMASVLVAVLYNSLNIKYLKFSSKAFYILLILLILFTLSWPFVLFPPISFSWLMIIVSGLILLYLLTKIRERHASIIGLATVYVSLFLSFVFYPQLLKYQVSSSLAHELNTMAYIRGISILGDDSHAMRFYSRQEVQSVAVEQAENIASDIAIIANPDNYRKLMTTTLKVVDTQLGFHVSTLKLDNLLAHKRQASLTDTLFLLENKK